jgi:hypothetical protein
MHFHSIADRIGAVGCDEFCWNDNAFDTTGWLGNRRAIVAHAIKMKLDSFAKLQLIFAKFFFIESCSAVLPYGFANRHL